MVLSIWAIKYFTRLIEVPYERFSPNIIRKFQFLGMFNNIIIIIIIIMPNFPRVINGLLVTL